MKSFRHNDIVNFHSNTSVLYKAQLNFKVHIYVLHFSIENSQIFIKEKCWLKSFHTVILLKIIIQALNYQLMKAN